MLAPVACLKLRVGLCCTRTRGVIFWGMNTELPRFVRNQELEDSRLAIRMILFQNRTAGFTAPRSMQRTLDVRIYQLLSDFWFSFALRGPKTRHVFDRKYMAAWHTFHDFDANSVKVLVDIGAHEGLYAKYAAQYFSLERTILIEPLPDKAGTLIALDLPGKEIVTAALADRVGTAQFTINATQQASSIKRVNANMSVEYGMDFTEKNVITVTLTTLDKVFDDLNLEKVDLVKIDVQGAERELLLGSRKSLPQIHFLQIEMLFADHYAGAAQFCELYQMLTAAGFRLARLKDFSHGPTGALLQCDGVFVNEYWS